MATNPSTAVPLCLPANCSWDEPLRTTVFDITAERGCLQLCPEGLDILRRIDKPVVVVCIAGLARSGKSFFLSQIQNGIQFEVGHGTTPKTTGIWIASADKFVTKNGQDTALILLDTEGLCSVSSKDNNTDTTWEKKLFTLSLLLSSYFIFNSQGTPTFCDLDKLAFVGELADYLKNSRDGKKDDASSFLGSSPDFLWLVRDAHLQPQVQGEKCSWGRFLKESVLKSRHDRRNDPTDLVRRAIVKTFGKIDAHGIPFPSTDPHVLQKLGSPEGVDMMQPAFTKSIQSAKSKIFAVAKEKTIKGRVMSGKELADFVEMFIEQLNSESGMIDAQSTYECFIALEEAETLYIKDMDLLREKMPCPSLEIRKCHNDAKKRANRERLVRTKLSPPFMRELHKRKFDQILERKLQFFESENQRLSQEECQKVRKDLISMYFQPIFDNPSKFDVQNVKATEDTVFKKYDLMAQGPEKDKVRSELLGEIAEKIKAAEKLVMHEAIKKSLNVYELQMVDLHLPCERDALNKRHNEAANLATSKFEELCSGGNVNFLAETRKQLEENIRDKMKSVAENNECLSLESCQDVMDNLVKQHFDPLVKNLKLDSYKGLTRALEIILQNYDSTAVGPKAKLVRKHGERGINIRIEQSQVQIAKMTAQKAVSIYKSHMQSITFPCSEIRLYRRDKEARAKAYEIFKTGINNFPASLINSQEQDLRWDLDGCFSSFRSQNFSQSRQCCQQLFKELEAKYRLREILRNPRLRDESTVRETVDEIMSDYKRRSRLWDGPAADEIQANYQTEYDEILKQCANESAEQIAAAAAVLTVAGGLAVWGLSKIFGGNKSDDED